MIHFLWFLLKIFINYRNVKKYMNNTFKKAIKQDRKAQIDCFGRGTFNFIIKLMIQYSNLG